MNYTSFTFHIIQFKIILSVMNRLVIIACNTRKVRIKAILSLSFVEIPDFSPMALHHNLHRLIASPEL